MENYVSSLKNNNDENILNVVIKSLNNTIDTFEDDVEAQDYTHIDYYGPLSQFTVKLDKSIDGIIPIFGTLGNTSTYIGYINSNGTFSLDIPLSEQYKDTSNENTTTVATGISHSSINSYTKTLSVKNIDNTLDIDGCSITIKGTQQYIQQRIVIPVVIPIPGGTTTLYPYTTLRYYKNNLSITKDYTNANVLISWRALIWYTASL